MRLNTMGLKWRRGIGGLLCSVLLAGSSYAYEYEEVTIADGGTLSGTIKLAGDIPIPRGTTW